jgi:hypothetical protein
MSTLNNNGPKQLSTLATRARAKAEAYFWKPEAGDSIEGVVVDIKTSQGRYGSTHWYLQRDDDIAVIISASPKSVLAKKIASERIQPGDRIYVELLGARTSQTGNNYNDWAVASEKIGTETSEQEPVGNGELADDDIRF